MDKSCVYWIHLPEHTDIFTQGYVGVSKTGAKARYWQHRTQANKGNPYTLYNAMRKHGDKMIVETVIRAPIEYCYILEFKLRPTHNIGYNIACGGVAVNLGRKHTEETKAKISRAGKGRKDSEETAKRRKESSYIRGKSQPESVKTKLRIKAKIRGVLKSTIDSAAEVNRNLMPWENPIANTQIWLLAGEVFEYMLSNPAHGTRNISKSIDATYSQLNVLYRKIKSGWNPYKDEDWLIFSSKLTPDTSGDKSLNLDVSASIK